MRILDLPWDGVGMPEGGNATPLPLNFGGGLLGPAMSNVGGQGGGVRPPRDEVSKLAEEASVALARWDATNRGVRNREPVSGYRDVIYLDARDIK